MIYFARIKAGNFHACGVFSSTVDALDTLGSMTDATIDGEFRYEHKPEHKMTEQDIADAGAMVVGAVVVLTAH